MSDEVNQSGNGTSLAGGASDSDRGGPSNEQSLGGQGGTERGAHEGSGGSADAVGTLAIITPVELHRSLVWNRSVDSLFWVEGGIDSALWEVEEGELPPGLEFTSDGRLVGEPTEIGEFVFVVAAKDAGGRRGKGEVRLVVESRSWVSYVVWDGEVDKESLHLVDLAPSLPVTVKLAEVTPDAIRKVSFSPDGRSLFFLQQTEVYGRCQLFGADLTQVSPGPQRVGEGEFDCSTLQWSPDGTQVAALQRLNAAGVEPESRLPVVVTMTDQGPQLRAPALERADTLNSIAGWSGDEGLLVRPNYGSLMVLYDLTDVALENPRSLGGVTEIFSVNAAERRFLGHDADSREAVDVDDGWSASIGSNFLFSPQIRYTYTSQSFVLNQLFSIESLQLPGADPHRSVGEEYYSDIRGPAIWFAGPAEELLVGLQIPEVERSLFEVDLVGDNPLRRVDVPDGCFPRHHEGTFWFSCFVGSPQMFYVYKAGVSSAFLPIFSRLEYDLVSTEVRLAPDESALLFTLTEHANEAPAAYTVDVNSESVSVPERLSPVGNETASRVSGISSLRWTADGMFAIYPMHREMSLEPSLFSTALWANKMVGERVPFNVSNSNNSCYSNEDFPAGHSCMRVMDVFVQPAARP